MMMTTSTTTTTTTNDPVLATAQAVWVSDESAPPTGITTTTTIVTAVPAVASDFEADLEAATTTEPLATATTATTTTPPDDTTPRAAFCSATLTTPAWLRGLTVASLTPGGPLCIQTLPQFDNETETNGPPPPLPFQVGDQLVSINGKSTNDAAVAHAWMQQYHLTGDATSRNNNNNTSGTTNNSTNPTTPCMITIVVHHAGGVSHRVLTMVEKPTPITPVGLSVQQTLRGQVLVSRIAGSSYGGNQSTAAAAASASASTGGGGATTPSLLSASLLNVGDRLVRLNDMPCPPNATAVVQAIAATPRYVTFLTETQGMATAVASTDAMWQEDARLNQQHVCICLWMIIISLLVVGAIIFQPFG